MSLSSLQSNSPRYFLGALLGGIVAGLFTAIGMMVLMLNTQASVFGMGTGSASTSIVFSPANLLLVFAFFIPGFSVWLLVYAIFGRAMLSYSVSTGKLSMGSWAFLIIILGIVIAMLANLNSTHQTMLSGPFLPACLIFSATLGFIVFWKNADKDGLQLHAKLKRQGLVSEKSQPAGWAIEAARRVAEQKD